MQGDKRACNTSSSFLSCTGSLSGKRIGNQENIPAKLCQSRLEITPAIEANNFNNIRYSINFEKYGLDKTAFISDLTLGVGAGEDGDHDVLVEGALEVAAEAVQHGVGHDGEAQLGVAGVVEQLVPGG